MVYFIFLVIVSGALPLTHLKRRSFQSFSGKIPPPAFLRGSERNPFTAPLMVLPSASVYITVFSGLFRITSTLPFIPFGSALVTKDHTVFAAPSWVFRRISSGTILARFLLLSIAVT